MESDFGGRLRIRGCSSQRTGKESCTAGRAAAAVIDPSGGDPLCELTLPAVCELLAKDAKAPFQQFFWKVSEDLGKRTGQTAGEIWSRNLKEIQKLLFLTKKEQQDLEEFGQLLGRMDMPMQLSAIQFYQEKIMLSLAEAKAAADSRQKLYRYLGALGGAALVLVIM